MIRITTFTTHWWDNARRGFAQYGYAQRGYAKRGLILALVPFLLACENDDFLSLPTTPGQPDLEILFTRILVPFSLVQFDSVNTTPNGFSDKQLLVGRLQNPERGSVAATSFMEFNVGTRSPVTEGAQYDSLVLEMIYSRSYGVSQNTSQTIEIHALDQGFASGRTYYNNNALAINPATLGRATFPTKLSGSNDTLHFQLDDVLGQDIFDRALATDSTVLSSTQFRDYLPGLALTPVIDNNFVGSFEPQGARIIMYFTDAESAVKEHTFTIKLFFNNITGDQTGTPLADLRPSEDGITATDGSFYLQSGTGVTPKIGMSSILNFVRSQSTPILLNRVDLNLGLAELADTVNAPSTLYAYDFEPGSLDRDTLTINQQQGTVAFVGLFNDQATTFAASPVPLNSGRYQVPITNYLRGLIASDTVDSELIILAEGFDSSVSGLSTVQDSIYLDVYYSLLR